MSEYNLSEKINGFGMLAQKEVKDFIKLLKERFIAGDHLELGVLGLIEKLAGEKLCCEKEIVKRKTIIIHNVEYELEQHDNGRSLKDISIPEGWRLLLPSEAMMLYEKGLIDEGFWFFVKQTDKKEEAKGNVAGFYAFSNWARLLCDLSSANSNNSLGVLFCREVKNG